MEGLRRIEGPIGRVVHNNDNGNFESKETLLWIIGAGLMGNNGKSDKTVKSLVSDSTTRILKSYGYLHMNFLY